MIRDRRKRIAAQRHEEHQTDAKPFKDSVTRIVVECYLGHGQYTTEGYRRLAKLDEETRT